MGSAQQLQEEAHHNSRWEAQAVVDYNYTARNLVEAAEEGFHKLLLKEEEHHRLMLRKEEEGHRKGMQ